MIRAPHNPATQTAPGDLDVGEMVQVSGIARPRA